MSSDLRRCPCSLRPEDGHPLCPQGPQVEARQEVLVPGAIDIVLAGIHKDERIIVLKQLGTVLLLVNYKIHFLTEIKISMLVLFKTHAWYAVLK